MKKQLLMSTSLTLLLSLSVIACSEDMTQTGSEKAQTDKKAQAQDELSMKVIYGEDDRKDLHEVKDSRLLHLAQSTALLIDSYNLEADGNNHYNIQANSFKYQFKLCELSLIHI